MTSNPFESPRPDQPPESELWLTWARISFGGIGLLLAGILLLGFMTAVTIAPDGYAFRSFTIVVAWIMIAIGLTVATIGGIGEWRSSSR